MRVDQRVIWNSQPDKGGPPLGRLVARKRRETGFTLWLIGVCLFVMIGALGLAFDMGRIFLAKNELQTFTDASAIASARLLDGSRPGIQNANTMANSGPMGSTRPNAYNFETAAIPQVTVTYATELNGTYDNYATASAPAANGYQFVKVAATASMPLDFLPVLPGIAQSLSLTATATAGMLSQSSVNYGGIDPFIPDSQNASDKKNFGFVVGKRYTLKWGNGNSGNGNGGQATTTCEGDVGWTDPNPTPQHGYVDLGQGTGSSGLRTAVIYGGFPNANSTPSSLYSGMTLYGVPGNRGNEIITALYDRAAQDTDQSSYEEYAMSGAIGRRVITVAVGNPATWSGAGNGSEMVVGFANFLLDPASSYSGGPSAPLCATYLGPASFNGMTTAATDGTKLYSVALYQ